MNPYSSAIETPQQDHLPATQSDAAANTTGFEAIRYADVVTSTFAIVMFGLAIPLNAYVMLAYADAFNFQNPMLVDAVDGLFPWLSFLFAIGIPALAYFNRSRLSGRAKTVATLLLLATTVVLGLGAFLIVSMPIVTWLNSL